VEFIQLGSDILTNAAKCSGSVQDQRAVKGTLDCESATPWSRSTQHKITATHCLDNLATGSFFRCPEGTVNKYQCSSFVEFGSFKKESACPAKKGPCKGVITKPAVAKLDNTAKSVGIVALKRIKCNDDLETVLSSETPQTCATFKISQCIKADKPFFKFMEEQHATHKELKAWGEYVTANAWTNKTNTAEIKPGWRCSDKEEQVANAWTSAF